MLNQVLAAAIALGIVALLLVAVCWRQRSVLGLVCAVLAIGSTVAAVTSGSAGSATDELVGALAAIVIGTVLLALGQAVQRLLDQEPDTGATIVTSDTAQSTHAHSREGAPRRRGSSTDSLECDRRQGACWDSRAASAERIVATSVRLV